MKRNSITVKNAVFNIYQNFFLSKGRLSYKKKFCGLEKFLMIKTKQLAQKHTMKCILWLLFCQHSYS